MGTWMVAPMALEPPYALRTRFCVPVVVDTRPHTGHAPKDKLFVCTFESEGPFDWEPTSL